MDDKKIDATKKRKTYKGGKGYSRNKKKDFLYMETDEEFINPYNFVGVNWDNTQRGVSIKGNLTGVLHCRLYTRTPLAIPGKYTFDKEIREHKIYDFMNIDGVPMIPGSSIRGPIRNIYETLTNSCFSTNDVDKRLSRRSAASEHGNAGLLIKKNGRWVLYEAKRHKIIMKDKEYKVLPKEKWNGVERYTRKKLESIWDARDGHVWFDIMEGYEPVEEVVNKISTEQEYNNEGYLFIGEVPPLDSKGHPQTAKRYESIFEKEDSVICEYDTNDTEEEFSEIRLLKRLIEMSNDRAINRIASGDNNVYSTIRKKVDSDNSEVVIPVWYKSTDSSLKPVITLAAIGRRLFETDMNHLLHDKIKCIDRNESCPACSLFGMIAGEASSGEAKGIGSRVRFSDAFLEGKPNYYNNGEEVLLRELSSPKPSYVPFYAKKWEEPANSYDEQGVLLRGRKYYWHFKDWDKDKMNYRDFKKTERNNTMRLLELDENTFFKFDVYYDGITQNELECLKWTLTLGDNRSDSEYCIKIGHGKPLGLGSVKIVITGEEQRSLVNDENDVCYKLIHRDAEKNISKKCFAEMNIPDYEQIIQEVRYISNIDKTKGIPVSYPRISDDEARDENLNLAQFRWFATNWPNKKHIKQELPSIQKTTIKNHRLKKYRYIDLKKRTDTSCSDVSGE